MGYRFYRFDLENDERIYQSRFVDVKKWTTGECRIPALTDARSEYDASVFHITEELALFIADWFGLWVEEVKED